MPGVLYARVDGSWVPISSGGGASEVEIAPDDPIGTNSAAELWFDSDDEPAAADNANYWNSAWGVVGETRVMTNSANVVFNAGNPTPVSDMNVTVTTVADRVYEISGHLGLLGLTRGTTANSTNRMSVVRDGGNPLAYVWADSLGPAGYIGLQNLDWTFTDRPPPGPHTYTINVYPGVLDTVNFQANSFNPRILTVEDVGPVTKAAVNPPAGQPQIATAGNALGIVAVGSLVPGSALIIAANTWTQVTSNINYTMLVGRRYRVLFYVRGASSTTGASTWMDYVLRDGATNMPFSMPIANIPGNGVAYDTIHYAWNLDGDGVARSFNIYVKPANIGANLFTEAGSGYFYIEDVGPNQAPALPIPDTPPGWTTVTYLNSWVAGSAGPMQYRKIGDIVYLRGSGKSGAAAAVFNLPVGFRPPIQVTTMILCQGGVLGYSYVTNGGDVYFNGPNNNDTHMHFMFSVTP